MAFINVVSSTVFFPTAVFAYIKKQLGHSFILAMLVLTSWCYHSNKSNKCFKRIDKTMVNACIFYGFFAMRNKKFQGENIFCYIVAFLCFFISGTLYYYGHYADMFCYSKDGYGEIYHAFVHGFASVAQLATLNLK